MRSTVVFSLSLVVLIACSARTENPHQGPTEQKRVATTRDVDLLFVIDDSVSMRDKQENAKANFKSLIAALETMPGGFPNVHIGVVTSDLGTKGADDELPRAAIAGTGGCLGQGKEGKLQTYGTPLVAGKFIEDIKTSAGSRSRNYTGTLAEAFSAIASAGDTGCFVEQHLEAAKRALSNNSANTGFLRPNAFLVIVFLADEDDCSMAHSSLLDESTVTLGPRNSFRCTRFGITCDDGGSDSDAMNQVGPKGSCHSNSNSAYLTKVEDYVTFFKNLKPDEPNKVVVAGILGTPAPFEVELRDSSASPPTPQLRHSCSYVNSANKTEVADPPIRLKQFLDSFPEHSALSTICQQDLSGGLLQIAQLLTLTLGDPCIEGTLADMDSDAAGSQYECSVADVVHGGLVNETKTVLPACNDPASPGSSTNKPCWTLAVDAEQCPTKRHQVLQVERSDIPAPDTSIVATCATCGDADNDGVCDM